MISTVDFYTSEYDKGGYEVPATATDGLTFIRYVQNVMPSTSRYGADGSGSIRIAVAYEEVYSADVLKLTYSNGLVEYAFVDSVRPLSTVNGAEVCEVAFTIDPWRSHWQDVDVVEAHFSRTPRRMDADAPEQTYTVARWADTGTKWRLVEPQPFGWVIINAVQNGIPTGYYIPFIFEDQTARTLDGARVPYLSEVLTDAQTALQLQTAEIAYAGWTDWPVAKVAEASAGVWQVVSIPADMTYSSGQQIGGQAAQVFRSSPSCVFDFVNGYQSPFTLREPLKRWIIRGYSDEIVDVTPYDELRTWKTVLVNNFSSCYIRVVAVDHELEWQVACGRVPLSKSAESDYLYSGQRQYELDKAEQDRTVALARGLTGAATGGASTGAFGMMGSNASVAPAMAAISAASGVAGALTDYLITGWDIEQSQRIKDTYIAQIGGIAMVGEGVYDLRARGGIQLVEQYPDSKSLSRWDASLSKYGLEDDRWDYPSLQATWNWNGPWKVDSSRIVRKADRNVPSWAITEIQRILTRGCYIGR